MTYEKEKQKLTYFEATRSTIARLIAEGASEEEVVNYDGYPEFYESKGSENAHYMRAWYRVCPTRAEGPRARGSLYQTSSSKRMAFWPMIFAISASL